MDGHRKADAVSDGLLDRELRSLMAAEPSPEFVARVRARVAAEPQPGRWRAAWMFALAGAVTVIVVSAIVWPSRDLPTSVVPLGTPDIARADLPAPSAPEPEPEPAPAPVARSSSKLRTEVGAAPEPETDLPEVLIADSERRGLELLLEELSDPDSAQAVAQAASGRNTPGPPWIEVGAVVVEPLQDVNIFEGVGQ